jgi:hypothetical protein
MRKGILVIVLATGIASCQHRASLPLKEYVKWVESKDNGLVVEKVVGRYKFTLQYTPVDYLIIKDQSAEGKEMTENDFDRLRREQSGEQYYRLRIGMADGSADIMQGDRKDQKRYEQKVEYFSFSIQNDLKLLEGKDTLACKLHHFEQSYGLAPYNTIIAVFDEKDGDARTYSGDRVFIYEDKMLGCGAVILTINGNSIGSIPKPVF